MKILQVTNFFKPAWESGGVTRVCYELAKNLSLTKNDVTVYTTDGFHSRLNVKTNVPVDVDGIRVYYFYNLLIPLVKKMNLTTPYYMPFILRKQIKEYDIIHIHEHRTLMAAFVHHYAKKYQIPYVLEPQGTILRMGRMQYLKKIFDSLVGYDIIKDSSKVIAGTELESHEEESMGVSPDRIALILPGYDIDSYQKLPKINTFRNKYDITEKNIILFLGRINEIKGLDYLVKSFYELLKLDNDSILVLVGQNDGFKPNIEKLVADLKIADKVLFTGLLTGTDKLAAYVDADIFVQPSKYERFCGSPFEAILCNTPIIVTKNTGCGNFVEQMNFGYTVDYDDVDSLQKIMMTVLLDSSEAAKKTKNAKSYITKNLGWKERSKKYIELYNDVVNGEDNGMENTLV